MGSGETSPTMVTVHRDLVARLTPGPSNSRQPRGVLLETPYGFQENATDISQRAQRYFADSVGLQVTVARGLRGRDDGSVQSPSTGSDQGLATIRASDWVFAGPGSPSYALEFWRDGPVGRALADRIRTRQGLTVLASAAAATAGLLALPVYEIYKAGAAPRWLDGLDLLGILGLPVAVIPHYDNAEGGTHDTRYCYLGERRLRLLEAHMPAGSAVLGVDEHTAALFDLSAQQVGVVGRGVLTVRRAGESAVFPAGTRLSFDELRALVREGRTVGADHRAPAQSADAAESSAPPPAPPLADHVIECERRFGAAATARDASGMVEAILDLETAIRDWSADTEEDQGTDQARDVLRSLIVRLGEVATEGLRDPREPLIPLVEPLVALREQFRAQRAYPAADTIRSALSAGGVRLDDTERGTRWSLQRG
jgi:cyanophycinase-like exopeptidase